MKIAVLPCLVFALLTAAAHARAENTVVMVTIDDFAQASRERAINEARLAALTGRMELYADVTPGMPTAARKSAEARIMLIRERVIGRMGIVARPYVPTGDCIRMPAAEAYAMAYSEASEAYFRSKLGAGFREQIEREVRREMRAAGLRQPRNGRSGGMARF